MDGGERRGSQYATPYQTPTQGRPAPGEPMGPPAQDRYAQLLQSPARSDTPRSSASRPYGSNYGSYGYHDPNFSSPHVQSGSPMQGVDIQYPTYAHDPTRPHQMIPSPAQPQYPTYAQGSMLPPMQQQNIYEDMSQYQQQRQTATMGMGNQFSVPTYMPSGEQSNVTVGGTHAQYMASNPEQTSYQAIHVARPQMQTLYTTSASDYSMLEQVGSHEQQEEEHNQVALDEGTRQYQQQMKTCFDAIGSGRVSDASEKLLAVSRWLLSSVADLGLHHDDESQYEQQLLMWRDFNYCWLALGMKQKDITEDALQTRHEPSDILSADTIANMVEELMGLCDQIEQYGLVDYQMGVWEDEILSVFTACLDPLQRADAASSVPAELGT